MLRYFTPILLLFLVLVILDGSDQLPPPEDELSNHYCAHDHLEHLLEASDPGKRALRESLERSLRQHLENNQQNARRGMPPPYVLPVVVHIVHDGGAENISDALVFQGIQDLNDAFANVGYYDQGTGVNTQIQFCLAQRDPNGDATNGITRDQSALTNMILETQDIALKDLNRWEPTEYINIWLVRNITSQSSGPGVAGYAYFPSSHGQPQDGIVMEANFFGSSPGGSGVIIHEMGHYLGLYHTFQGGCTNNDCLADGDRVCDTPPDQSTAPVPCNATPNSCNTDTDSGLANDQNDMFINYMDYGDFDCYSALTQGQTERMYFFIENTRQSLLESEGCLDPCTIDITADFTAGAPVIDAGQTVNFNNNSINATEYDWQIDGSSFSSAENPSFNFNDVGIFQVILYATNGDPNCLDSDTLSITVNCPTIASFTGAVQFPALGETLNFTNTSAGANSYEWLINGVSQGTDTDFSYTFDISGNYTICLDAVGPFCDDTECATVFVFDNEEDCESTFIKTFGLPNSEEVAHSIVGAEDGGFYIAGSYSFDQSFIAKVASNGNVAWTRHFDLAPSFGNEYIRNIHIDSDGMIIGAGSSEGSLDQIFFFRYDPLNDIFFWNNYFVNQGSWFFDIKEEPGGDYIAHGRLNACKQAYIIKIAKNSGAFLWDRAYVLGHCQTLLESVIVGDEIFTTGRYTDEAVGLSKMRGAISSFQLDGTQNWSRQYIVPIGPGDNARIYPRDIILDSDNLVSLSEGEIGGTSLIDNTIQLYSTDLDGNIQWAKDIDIVGGSTERTIGLVNFPDGYLIAGSVILPPLGNQIILIKTNKQGEIVWSKQYGDNGNERALDVFVNNGFINVVGSLGNGTNSDYIHVRLNLEGETFEPCDQIQDLELTSENFINPYDGFNPLTEVGNSVTRVDLQALSSEIDFEVNSICGSQCIEICDNGVDDDDDGYVDCYDDECPCNTEVCNVSEIDQNFSTQLAWQSTVNEVAINGTPIVANLDPQIDSMPEIISIVSGSSATQQLSQRLLIFKGDGSNAASPDILPIQGGYDIYSAVNPAVGDVDRNGIPEVIMVSGDRRIRVYTNYDANTNPAMDEWIVSSDLVDDRNRKPYLADFNSDGIAEIYVGDDIFQFDFSGPVPTLSRELNGGASAGLNYYNFYGQPNCSPVAVDLLEPQHCNGDPDCNGLELVAGEIIYSIDLETNDGDGFEIKIQRDLNVMQNQHEYRDGYTSVADVNLDGILDVIVSSARGSQEGVYVWDRNGLLAWFAHQPPPLSAFRSGALACVANVYDDTQAGALIDYPEIIVSSQGFLNCYSLNADALGQPDGAWWIINTTDFSGNTGATVFDFNGDGTEEIIYRDEDNLRIMYGGAVPFPAGVDADRNWSTFVCGSGTFEEHPIVADVDNDRQAEIAVTGYLFSGTNNPPADYRGRLRVFEADLAGGDPWMSARPIWNQFNYFATNINDDLTLPIEQQLHHLELPQVGSNYRPLNKFVAQIPLLDNDFEPYLPVPDATINAGEANCAGDSISVALTVCNEGSATLPAFTPITFYLGNPLLEVVSPHHTIELGEDLMVDSCRSFYADIPNGTGTFHLVINDDGSQTTPYNFGNDFPFTGVAECNYANNPATFSFDYEPPSPPDLGPDQFFCNNGVANLDAGPEWTTYRWQDGLSDQVYTAWEAGTYWVEVTDECGRMQSDTVVIEIDSANQFDLGPDTTLCPGESILLDVPGFDEYEWLPEEGLGCSDCSPITITPTSDTTFTLVARDANGCISVDSIHIELSGFSPSTDTLEICPGDSILIFDSFRSEAGTYSDTLVNLNGCDTILTIELQLLPYQETSENIEICAGDSVLIFGTYRNSVGSYVDTLSSSTGCPTIQTINLDIRPPLSGNINIDPLSACAGSSNGSALVSISGTADFLQFEWSNNTTNQNLENVNPGTYELTVTDELGCIFIDTVEIEEFAIGDLSMEIQAAACFGSSDGVINITNYEPGTVFSLNGFNYTGDSVFTNLVAGSYTLYSQSANGCELEQEITISQPAPMVLSLPPDMTLELGDSVRIQSQTNVRDSITYLWSPPIWLSCMDCPAPWSRPLENVVYTLTVTDSIGCTETDDIAIRLIRDLDVYVPSGFSPNEDGTNDRFTVFAGQSVAIIRRMMIFDRWGNQVFEGSDFPPNDLSFGWDGSFRNKPMNPAVFTWMVEVEYIDGNIQSLAGDVTLIR
ncbi:MAG: M43 family zinc metalloprotease [Bacteroidota bacterium]